MFKRRSLILHLVALGLLGSTAQRAAAIEHVVFRRDGRQRTLEGRVQVAAADGGVLLQTRDGALWTVPPEELVSRWQDAEPFEPDTSDELETQLLAQLPPGFEVLQTQHYVICYGTSRAYAQWCGALFERLYTAFTNFWTKKEFALDEPEFPLAAIVFPDRESYRTFARDELGPGVSSIIGYYSLKTNRMTMYDLTGGDGPRPPAARRSTAAEINRVLSRPGAERTVATIIHEATHQIAFNSGLQTRYADIPLWVSEGIAVYFETPDLTSRKGWRSIGEVNAVRLARFAQYYKQRPENSLRSLIADDARMRDPRRGEDAYAEAWALNHFLIRKRWDEYRAYLVRLSEKPPMVWDDPRTRVEEFTDAFGDDLRQLDAEFLRHVEGLR